ncbi:hypothetical protein D3C73_1364260 [compost metagenome]
MDFQLICAVFQLIAFSNHFAWQFMGFTHRNKPNGQPQGDWCAKQEAARFGADNFRDTHIFVTLNQQFNAECVSFRVFQQAGDIAEKNARFWVVVDAFDAIFEKLKLLCSCGHKFVPD